MARGKDSQLKHPEIEKEQIYLPYTCILQNTCNINTYMFTYILKYIQDNF